MSQAEIEIRPWSDQDSIRELTGLLHIAYKRLGDMGLNFTAVDQSVRTTRSRMKEGQCLVAVRDGKLVGTIMCISSKHTRGCDWYDRPEVSGFGQFAVLPGCQGLGVGLLLLTAAEEQARRAGSLELALDTAEPAVHLIDWYAKRGYRTVDSVQWRDKSYRSLIMSKTL